MPDNPTQHIGGGNNNAALHAAKVNGDNEFYTQLSDIENELKHYTAHFKDKVVFCNCDDPEWSNFWIYFRENFDRLGLKKLISTHYEEGKQSYKMELTGARYENGELKYDNFVTTPLKGDGDFRSDECVAILKEADIVVTNPPFSLFREYIEQLMEYNKKFLIIGNQNAITYRTIFPHLRDNTIWLGVRYGDMSFKVPPYSPPRKTRYWVDETGQKWRSMGNICWFTNLDHYKRHEQMTLYREYTPEAYPKYSNYDVIEVSKVNQIPVNYKGVMGVPVTFMYNYSPEQFRIIGMAEDNGKGYSGAEARWDGKNPHCVVNGEAKYKRIFVSFIQHA